MVIVRFIKGASPYQGGELAGFPEDEARRFITAGIAEKYKEQEAASEDKQEISAEDKMIRIPKGKK